MWARIHEERRSSHTFWLVPVSTLKYNFSVDIVTSIIVWATPVVLGFASWALVELFKDLKDDVKDLKTSNSNIRTDIAKQGVQITNLDTKVNLVSKSVDAVKIAVHDIDKRTIGVSDLNNSVKVLSDRMNESDRKYGQILIILDGMAKRIGITFKKSGS